MAQGSPRKGIATFARCPNFGGGGSLHGIRARGRDPGLASLNFRFHAVGPEPDTTTRRLLGGVGEGNADGTGVPSRAPVRARLALSPLCQDKGVSRRSCPPLTTFPSLPRLRSAGERSSRT